VDQPHHVPQLGGLTLRTPNTQSTITCPVFCCLTHGVQSTGEFR